MRLVLHGWVVPDCDEAELCFAAFSTDDNEEHAAGSRCCRSLAAFWRAYWGFSGLSSFRLTPKIGLPGDDTSQMGLADPALASPPLSGVKASDADRERAIGVLREAFAEGRLTAEEHSARVGQAYSARTYAELAAVSADLPTGTPENPPAPRSSSPTGVALPLTAG